MYALTNANVFDGHRSDLQSGVTVLVDGTRIVSVTSSTDLPTECEVIDCAGRTLMPGLIDAHVHAYASRVNLVENDNCPTTYVAQHAHTMLGRMLRRGFTTVRDCGGAEHGLAQALKDGLVMGPRLLYAGKILSQSGGHGDLRHPAHGEAEDDFCWACGCGHVGHISVTADGVDQVRRAVRENFRRGASFIKFAASGGVSSPSGSLTAMQYSDDEVRAIVDESERHEKYCTAHVHPDAAIRRVIDLGVHCIEHASLIEMETAQRAADAGTHVVPTLSIAQALLDEGESMGLAPGSLEKLARVMAKMMNSLEYLKEAGVLLGFGTDLLGPLEKHQCREFEIRAEVFTPFEILQQATVNSARILGLVGEVGEITPGASADLIVLEGNPLQDLTLLQRDGENFDVVMQGGEIVHGNLKDSQFCEVER